MTAWWPKHRRISAGSSNGALTRRRRWDLAIWVDALGSPTFNPVLVKYGLDRSQKAELLETLSDLDLLFGIYVSDYGEPHWDIAGSSMVVSVGARRLEDYSKRQFRKLMVDTRDRLVRAQS